MPSSGIDFDDAGIGAILTKYTLVVPVNQRPYAWLKEHVQDLFSDLERAIDDNEPEYFLGTMVGISLGPKLLDVADGQQRLATTVILLAAIRDHLANDPTQANYRQHIERSYLSTYDPDSDGERPKLTLNVEDNEVFTHCIIAPPKTQARRGFPDKPVGSTALLMDATLEAKSLVAKIVNTPRVSDQIARIKKWVKFLDNSAKMILVIVPDQSKAFTIFETLNDRGLKLSQVHLLKNYLYGRANSGNRMREAQKRWDAMYGALESLGEDDIYIDYIRQMWISYHGHIKADQLFEDIKRKKKSPGDAVELAGQLADNVTPYMALLNPSHSHWGEHYGIRRAVQIMNDALKVDRVRPLMLSIAMAWAKKPRQIERAFCLCVSWAVRFLIVGGIGSGTTEKFYAETARRVRAQEIPDAKALAVVMKDAAPKDDEFAEAFERATISRAPMARYFLHVLEEQYGAVSRCPLLAPEENPENFDLEHVLPHRPSGEWNLSEDDCARLAKRIGNLAILEKRINSSLKSAGPKTKLAAYADSSKSLTQLMKMEKDWGEEQIVARQQFLAQHAIKAWPMKV